MSSRSTPVTLSVMGRLMRTRRVAFALLLALGGLVFGALTVKAAVRMRAAPIPGVELDGLTVTATSDARLRPGDRIVAVDDIRTYHYRLVGLIHEITATGIIPVTFAHADGFEVEVPVTTRPLDDLHEVALWVRVICGLLCFLVGVTSFILTPGSRAAWLFLFFSLNLEVTLLYNVLLVRDGDLFARLEPITFALGGSLGLHLFTELPTRLGVLVRRPFLAALIYVPAALIVTPALVTLPPPFSAAWAYLALCGVSWSLAGGIICTAILLGRLRGERDEALRSRIHTLLLALLVGLFLPALVHTYRAVTGAGQDRWVVHMNAAPVVVYAAATGYALLRQNVLGADRFTAVVVSYAATLILLGLGCGLALVAVPLIVQGRVASSPTLLVVTTAAASFSIVPVYRRLKRIIDRQFMRDRATDERITAELHELLRLAMLGDPGKTMEGAFKALGVLAPDRIELWVREAGAPEFHRRRGGDPGAEPVAVGSELGKAMVAEQTGGVEGLAPTPLAPGAQAELWARELAVAAPVGVQGEVRAFMALGRQSSGKRYRAGEQSFLTMVATQVGLALERGEEGTSIGRYRLERRLGTGGMAEVYLARQIGLGGFERLVAIKRPLPHLAEDGAFVAMLLDEAKLAAQLHHPNIVQTYEVDRQGGTYYIAMEYVEGASLRALLRSGRTSGDAPPVAVTARIADALLSALAHAHGATDGRGRRLSVVHRDVTPGNVLISIAGEVKLVDFGVARSVTRLQVTQTGMVKGTLAYMAPEQAHGGEVDARSDLFGAGALLYECLMAEPPYPDGPPRERPGLPPAVRVDLPPALVVVVQRALAFAPGDRYASAEEMRAAFLAAVGVAPASAEAMAGWIRDTLGAERVEDVAFQEAETAVDSIR